MAGPGDELRAAAKALQATTKKSMRSGGNDLKRDLRAAVAAATGGDRVYSGAGGKLDVTVSVTQGRSITTLTVKPSRKTSSQWEWANTGTRAGRRRARRGRSRYVMRHPGTRGRGAWDRVVDRDVPKIVERLRDEIGKAVS